MLDPSPRSRPLQRRLVVPALGFAALFGLALLLDQPLSDWGRSLPAGIRDVFRIITQFGLSDWYLYPSLALLVLGVLALRIVRTPRVRLGLRQLVGLSAFIFFAIGVPSLFTAISKRFIGRARPGHGSGETSFELNGPVLDWTLESFPSGHSTTAMAAALVVALLWPRWRWPALALAALVGASRVVLGAHYPSDVLAGFAVGALGVVTILWVFLRRDWVFRRAGTVDGEVVRRPLSALWRMASHRGRVLPNS